MQVTLNKLGKQQRGMLCTKAHFYCEKTVEDLEKVRKMLIHRKDIIQIDAEIGLCRSLFHWFVKILESNNT